MNLTETKKIMSIIKAAYPAWVKETTREDLQSMVELWAMQFAEDDPNIVTSAVMAHISSNRFAPSVAEVKDQIYKIRFHDELNEQEAWNAVYKAICNSGYNSRQEYEKLPAICQKLVTPQLLRDWSQMDANEVSTVVASNFMRSYKDKSKKLKEYSALPNVVKQQIGNGFATLTIRNGNSDD